MEEGGGDWTSSGSFRISNLFEVDTDGWMDGLDGWTAGPDEWSEGTYGGNDDRAAGYDGGAIWTGGADGGTMGADGGTEGTDGRAGGIAVLLTFGTEGRGQLLYRVSKSFSSFVFCSSR